MAERLKDKVAVITGAGSGLGRAYALGFSREGARIVIPDIVFGNAQKVASEIEAKGGQALAMHTDISDEASTQEMARRTIERFGKLDILVNNAAFYGRIALKPFYEISVDEWDRAMAVNLRGTFLCCKAVFPTMKEQGKGKIVNIASDVAFSGAPCFAHYVTSKGGIIAFTKAIARELGEYGINVNSIAPGLTETDAAKYVNPSELWTMVGKETCLKRVGQPEDLVGAVIFLSSEESNYITGQTLVVNGGYVMH